MTEYRQIAAEQGTKIIRLRLALQILRDWNSKRGFDGRVVVTIHDWIDGGMEGPIPDPKSPFFDEWAEKNGIAKVGGFLGYAAVAYAVGEQTRESK